VSEPGQAALDVSPLRPWQRQPQRRPVRLGGLGAPAELLRRLGRRAEAGEAYRAALGLALPRPERAYIERRLAGL